MGDEKLVHDLVGMMVVDHQHLHSVDLSLAHGRNILLRGAVVHQDNERHLLAVPGLVLKSIGQILGHILQLIEGSLAGGAAVIVVLRIRTPHLLDQRQDGVFNGHSGGYPVRIGMMAHHNGLGLENRPADLLGHLLHGREKPGHDLALHQKLRRRGLGPPVDGLLDLVFNR